MRVELERRWVKYTYWLVIPVAGDLKIHHYYKEMGILGFGGFLS